MLQKPGATSYIGCIGKDKFGEVMKRDATSAGVNVMFICALFSFLLIFSSLNLNILYCLLLTCMNFI